MTNEEFIKKMKQDAAAKDAAAAQRHAESSRAGAKSSSQQAQENYAQQKAAVIASRQPGYLMGNSGATTQSVQNRLSGSTQSVLEQVQQEQKRKSLLNAITSSSKKTITPVSIAKTAANVATGKTPNYAKQAEDNYYAARGITNDTEKAYYQAGQLLNSSNPILSGVTYPVTKVASGLAGPLLTALEHGKGWGEKAIGAVTGNEKLSQMGNEAISTDILNALNRGIDDTAKPTTKAEKYLGDVASLGGQVASMNALGGGISNATKISANIAPKIAEGIELGTQGTAKAMKEGATPEQAAKYGTLTGTMNAATEGIFGGIPLLGKGIADEAVQALPGMAQIGVNALGEGGENALQTGLDPLLQRMTYNPNAKNVSGKELAESFGQGAAFSGLMQGANTVLNGGLPAQVKRAEPIETLGQSQTPALASTESGAQLSNELGAANSGFDPYTHLQNQYGDIAPGENPSRVIDVPLKTSDNMNVSRGVRTAMEAKATPDAALDSIQNAVVDEKFSFETITDQAAETRANQTISSKGYETALRDWTADARSGKVSKDLMAQGQVLYNNAVNAGDYKTGVDILTDYVKMSRSGAQATQANRMLKKMDPQYQLYALERQSQSISDELTQKFKKSGFEGIKLNEDLVKQFSEAPDQTTRDAVMDKLKDDVAAQIPPSWKDKWDAWRYLAMLGNPRTHFRNIVGNGGFVPVREVKNIIGAGIEKATGSDRTKSVLTFKDSDLVKYAAKDYAAVSDQIMQNGKFDDLASDINSRKTIYKNPLLETLRKGNSAALDAEDVWFAKPAYANSLAGYYKANGITAEALADGSVPQATIDKARTYAIKEAKKATYRDSNDFSDWISRIGKYRGENKWAKAGSTLVEGVLPFRRTPANILARAWEYSPGEFLNVLTGDIRKVSAGDMDASEMIDHISSGLTGTAIMGLGAYLASEGLLTGGKSDDDDEAALAEQQGYQDYALNIGGKSITLDWLAPEALPLFTGAEIFKTLLQKTDGKITLAKVLTNFSSMAEPMIDMSMLQGVNDLIDSVKYSKGNGILSIAATTAANYLSQALPTLGGQIERIGEKERQTTYIDKTSGVPTAMQYMLGKAANKIPGVEYQQRPYTDMFGQTQSTGSTKERVFNNLFNPAYVRDIKQDDVTDELSRLTSGKYFSNVPGAPEQKITYGGEEYNLSKDEYTKYAEKAGKLEHDYAKAMMDNSAYSKMTDKQKADYIKQMFSYAKDEAQRDYVTGKGSDYESQLDAVYHAQQAGIQPDSYYAYKKYLKDITGKESGTQAQEAQAANKLDLTQRMKGKLWAIQNTETDASKNPFTGTAAQAGIAPETIIDVQTTCSEYTADKDKNGKSISGTKRAKQLAYINSQNLTTAQKDALYRSVGLAESTLHNAPWH